VRTSFETLRRMDGRLRRVGPLQRRIIEELANAPEGAYVDQLAFVLAVPEGAIRRAVDRLEARGLLVDPDRPTPTSPHFMQIVMRA
jgi:DNA-binding MarR family transcriptional regulator